MSEPSSLASFYEGWSDLSAELGSVVRPLDARQLELRAGPEQRMAGAIVKHMVEARAFWFGVVLGVDEPAFTDYLDWGDDGTLPPAGDLASGLEATMRGIVDQLDRWTPEEFAEEFQSAQGTAACGRASFSRRWVTWHVLEHDLVHGGELFLTLGTHHLAVPDW